MKRFTETEKWEGWYRRLAPEHKLLWGYLNDKCDPAGVIEPDFDLISFKIGLTLTEADMAALGEHVQQMDAKKWWLPGFLQEQYVGPLSEKCKGHMPAIRAVRKHRISYPIVTLSGRVSNTLQDRTGQDRTGHGQDMDRTGGAGGAAPGAVEDGLSSSALPEASLLPPVLAPETELPPVVGPGADPVVLEVELPAGFPGSAEEAVKRIQGLALREMPHPDFIREVWTKLVGVGCRDGADRLVTNWPYHVNGRWMQEKESWFAKRSQSGEKKESGGGMGGLGRGGRFERPAVAVRVRTHPRLPEPPCDWRPVLIEIFPADEFPSLDHAGVPWGLLEPDVRRDVVSECRRKGLLEKGWVQPGVPEGA